MSPTVSICIPAYNQPHSLRRALASISAQTFTDYEIVVTDDTPGNAVAEVVADFTPALPIIYRHHPIRKGTPENWNEAVRLASGRYIKILHHDDWFTGPGSLGRFVALLEQNPGASFGFSASQVCGPDGLPRSVFSTSARQINALLRDPRLLLRGNCIGPPSATIYDRGAGLEYDRLMQWLVDIDFYMRILYRSPVVVYSPQPLVAVTVGSAEQVTAVCVNNAAVEVREHLHLYTKIGNEGSQGWLASYLLWKLLARYQIRSLADIRAQGFTEPIPARVGYLLAFQQILPLYDLARRSKRIMGL